MVASTRLAVALHVLVALAHAGRRGGGGATSEQIASSVSTNPVVVRRILGALSRAGLVTGQGGRSGGYQLARDPARIHLDVVHRAVEPDGVLTLHENPENKACIVSCGIKGAIGGLFAGAEKALQRELRRTTVADLVTQVEKHR
jgi:Rrf2 family protein